MVSVVRGVDRFRTRSDSGAGFRGSNRGELAAFSPGERAVLRGLECVLRVSILIRGMLRYVRERPISTELIPAQTGTVWCAFRKDRAGIFISARIAHRLRDVKLTFGKRAFITRLLAVAHVRANIKMSFEILCSFPAGISPHG
jgi:hypothetical protein